MRIDDYRNLVHEDIEIARDMNGSTETEEVLSYATGILMNGEEFDDFIECRCSGITRRGGYYGIDGYSIDEADGSCCIFIVDYHGPGTEDAIRSDDVKDAFKKIRFFRSDETESYNSPFSFKTFDLIRLIW